MILVVGGGIAGLALAVALSRHGIPCELIERESTWTTTGAGITIYPNGIRALDTMGLAEAVRTAGRPVDRVRTLNAHGELVAESAGAIQNDETMDFGPDGDCGRQRVVLLEHPLLDACGDLFHGEPEGSPVGSADLLGHPAHLVRGQKGEVEAVQNRAAKHHCIESLASAPQAHQKFPCFPQP